MKMILALGLLAVFCAPAQATRHNGNDLLHECTSTDATTQRGCLAFISGVIEGVRVEDRLKNLNSSFDIPNGTTLGVLKNAVVAWVQAHPESQESEASLAVVKAISSTYPAK
jgi:hypothetical protein